MKTATSRKPASRQAPGMINPRQVTAIHATISKLGMDDETYRAMLKNRYNVTTCKGLRWSQAEELLAALNPTTSKFNPHLSKRGARGDLPYSDMDGRQGFASGAQCRLIAAMFWQITRAEGDDAKEKALNRFCERITKSAGLRMVKTWQVEKIIKALESMGAVKKS